MTGLKGGVTFCEKSQLLGRRNWKNPKFWRRRRQNFSGLQKLWKIFRFFVKPFIFLTSHRLTWNIVIPKSHLCNLLTKILVLFSTKHGQVDHFWLWSDPNFVETVLFATGRMVLVVRKLCIFHRD